MKQLKLTSLVLLALSSFACGEPAETEEELGSVDSAQSAPSDEVLQERTSGISGSFTTGMGKERQRVRFRFNGFDWSEGTARYQENGSEVLIAEIERVPRKNAFKLHVDRGPKNGDERTYIFVKDGGKVVIGSKTEVVLISAIRSSAADEEAPSTKEKNAKREDD